MTLTIHTQIDDEAGSEQCLSCSDRSLVEKAEAKIRDSELPIANACSEAMCECPADSQMSPEMFRGLKISMKVAPCLAWLHYDHSDKEDPDNEDE